MYIRMIKEWVCWSIVRRMVLVVCEKGGWLTRVVCFWFGAACVWCCGEAATTTNTTTTITTFAILGRTSSDKLMMRRDLRVLWHCPQFGSLYRGNCLHFLLFLSSPHTVILLSFLPSSTPFLRPFRHLSSMLAYVHPSFMQVCLCGHLHFITKKGDKRRYRKEWMEVMFAGKGSYFTALTWNNSVIFHDEPYKSSSCLFLVVEPFDMRY